MARTLIQIQREMAKLEKEAERVKNAEVSGVIQKIKVAIEFYGITAADLFAAKAKRGSAKGAKRSAKGKKSPSPAKYRNQETGKTWTGHGMRPGWFREAVERGVKPEDMAI